MKIGSIHNRFNIERIMKPPPLSQISLKISHDLLFVMFVVTDKHFLQEGFQCIRTAMDMLGKRFFRNLIEF